MAMSDLLKPHEFNRSMSCSTFQNLVTRLLKVFIKSTSAVSVSAGSASVPQASSPAYNDIIKRRINFKTSVFIIMFASMITVYALLTSPGYGPIFSFIPGFLFAVSM